ncbi:MAG: hypothetical protein AAGH79_03010 [Bacteroidota bacterium]
MTKYLPLFALLVVCIISNCQAQTLAITEYGDTVYIFNDGTWSFSTTEPMAFEDFGFLGKELSFENNDAKFSVPESATEVLESGLGFFTWAYNRDEWMRMRPEELNPLAEFAFKHKEKDIYAMAISEEVSMDVETIVKVALDGMETNTGSEVDIRRLEFREVNGKEMAMGRFRLDFGGMNLVFENYYFTCEKGTVQVLTWTAANIFPKYEKLMQDMLNGVVYTPE